MIFDKDWQLIDAGSVDLYHYKLVDKSIEVTATWAIDDAGTGDYVTIKEYPETGGKDVGWRWTVEPTGHWCWKRGKNTNWDDCPLEPDPAWEHEDFLGKPYEAEYSYTLDYQLYQELTEQQVQEYAAEQAEQAQAEAEAKAQAEEMAALPDAVAELSEMAADNETSAADLADAIADLSQLVSDLLESTSA